MARLKLLRSVAVLVLTLGWTNATAQSVGSDVGAVVMRVEVPVSTRVQGGASTPSYWRVYEQVDQLLVRFHVTNESREQLGIVQTGLRQAVALRAANNDIAVDLRWIDEVLLPDRRGPLSVPLDTRIALEPHRSVAVTAAIVRVDGRPFSSGTYRFTHSVSNLSAAISSADGAPWSGRVPEGAWELAVRVQPSATAEEQGTRHILEAHEMEARQEFTAALDAYARAAKANPADLSGIYGMAHMYRELQRFREAVPLYEQVLKASGGSEHVAFFAALAHLGAGDENSARRVLRQTGVPEDEILERIGEMRGRLDEDVRNRP